MYELDSTGIFLSIIFTWAVGLTPPILIRYILLKHPIAKWPAIGVCTFFWICNLILFIALGSKSKTHGALMLVAFVSYAILRRKDKTPIAIKIPIYSEQSPNETNSFQSLGGWERLLVLASVAWLIFASVVYFLILGGSNRFLELVPSLAFNWVGDQHASPNLFGDFPVAREFSILGFSTFLISPVLLSWGGFWVAVRIVRWVRAGFHR